MAHEPLGFSFDEELRKLREWRHDRVDPALRALELRDEHKDAQVERLSAQLARVSTAVDEIAKREELQEAIAEAVSHEREAARRDLAAAMESGQEAVRREHDTWVRRLTWPQRALLYAAGVCLSGAVVVNAVVNLANRLFG